MILYQTKNSAISCFSPATKLQFDRFWKLFIALSCIFLALFMPVSGNAQNATLGNTTLGETGKLRAELKELDAGLRFEERNIADPNADDATLAKSKTRLGEILAKAKPLLGNVSTRAAAVETRLKEIGTAPEDGVSEAPEVTASRASLGEERAELAALKTEIEALITKAGELDAAIKSRRSTEFSQSLFGHTALDLKFFQTAKDSLAEERAALVSLLVNWWRFVRGEKFGVFISSLFVSLLAALGISVYSRRLFGKVIIRSEAQPTYFNKLYTAFWATLLPSLATVIFLSLGYLLFDYFDIFSASIKKIALALLWAFVGGVFVWHLAAALFAPLHPNWRLFPVTNKAAKTLFLLIFVLYCIQAFDYVLDTVSVTLEVDRALTEMRGLVASLMIGGVLLLIALVRPFSRVNAKRQRWPAWFGWPLFLTAMLIIATALLGYIGMSRFIAKQVIVTGAILATMGIGLTAAHEMGKEHVFLNSAYGRRLSVFTGLEDRRIEQMGLLFSLALTLLVLLIGIPAILTQWGTRLEEIFAFARSLFTGLDIGGFHLSLSAIFTGIALFIVALVITRLLRGWVSRRVLSTSHTDAGIRESVRAGISYTGFAIAVLIGLTAAGIEFSDIAIVAGALSLGIGFGLQNVVSNFVSGLILLVERPIKIGDWITVGGAEGTVKSISVRATELETFQRQSIIVPNSELINSQVANWTFKNKAGRLDIPIGVAYHSDPRQVAELLIDIAKTHELVAYQPEPVVSFVDFGESSLDFVLKMHLRDVNTIADVATDIRFAIIEKFREHKIEIPFPQRDLNIRGSNGEKPEAAGKSKEKKRSAKTK